MKAYLQGGPRDGEVREVEDPGPDQIHIPIPPPTRLDLRGGTPMVMRELEVSIYEKSPFRGIYLWRGQED